MGTRQPLARSLAAENNFWAQFHGKKTFSKVGLVCRLISCLQKWFDVFTAVTVSLSGPGHLKHRVWLCVYIFIYLSNTQVYIYITLGMIKVRDLD